MLDFTSPGSTVVDPYVMSLLLVGAAIYLLYSGGILRNSSF